MTGGPPTVTITPQVGLNAIGPGLFVNLSSNFVGPPAAGFFNWHVNIYPVGGENPYVVGILHGDASTTIDDMVWNPMSDWSWGNNTPAAVPDGTTVNVVAQQMDFSTTVAEGQTTLPWDSQSGLWQYINYWLQKLQGQIPADESANIQEILTNTQTMDQNWTDYEQTTLPSLQDDLNNIITGITATVGAGVNAVARTIGQLFSGPTLADLTLEDLGSACAPDVLTATAPIGGSAYGLQVQITQLPDYIVWTPPADDYSVQVLADLQISRGGNIVLRHGIHTKTYMLYPMPGIPLAPVVLDVPVDPGDYEITITPSPNCCVAAQLLGFP